MAEPVAQLAVAELVQSIDDNRDDPCVAYRILQQSMAEYVKLGAQIPAALRQIEKDLSVECFAESQGR